MGEVARQRLRGRVDGGAYLQRSDLQILTPIVTRRLRRLVTLPPLREGR